MAGYLLDTHAFLWWLENSPRFGDRCRSIIANPLNEIYLSTASLWEISLKKTIGKLKAPGNLEQISKEKGFLPLVITLTDGEVVETLPSYHKDPFDRILIVQALNNKLTLVTEDKKFVRYKVKTVSVSK